MKLFGPPTSSYKSYYEQGAFDLTWRYNVYMALLYVLLILAGAIISVEFMLAGLLCWATPAISLLVLKNTRRYESVAYAQVFLGSTFTGLLLNVDLVLQFHIVEVIFMLITVFYAFISLRRKVGIICLVVQLFWFTLFLFREHNLRSDLSLSEKISLFLTLCVGLALFGYLIIEFLKLRRAAENKYVSINRDLNEINHIVNMQYHEKTVMLKEIHHRVKNNLQVISSLLRLQSYEIEEESSRMHFQDAIYRVSAMALIHEKMYQNEDLSQINLENYIQTLASDLIRTHANDIAVKLNVFSDVKELGNDTLVPVALMLNELITNSLKHAFTGKKEGLIEIEIRRLERKNYFSFVYKDGGNWKKTEKTSSFGLELISTLTEQLDGQVERTSEQGTKYTFILKDLK